MVQMGDVFMGKPIKKLMLKIADANTVNRLKCLKIVIVCVLVVWGWQFKLKHLKVLKCQLKH